MIINLSLKKIFVFVFLSLTLLVVSGIINKVQASSLLINPPFGNVEEGDDLVVDIVVKGEDETIDGVDAVISYNVNFLKMKEIKEGTFFSNYPVKKDDNGEIRLTALAPKDGVKITGDIVVATISFEVQDSGDTDLAIKFEANSTKESNVPVHGTAVDSLREVKGGTYRVVATPEKLRQAEARKPKKSPPLWPIFVIILILGGVGVWYYLKNRKPPPEAVFIPEEFPLDRPPPKVE